MSKSNATLTLLPHPSEEPGQAKIADDGRPPNDAVLRLTEEQEDRQPVSVLPVLPVEGQDEPPGVDETGRLNHIGHDENTPLIERRGGQRRSVQDEDDEGQFCCGAFNFIGRLCGH